MDFTLEFILHFLVTMMLSVILTPLVKLLAFQVGAVDYPGKRRINQKVMPTIGGLAIFIAFAIGSIWHEKSVGYFVRCTHCRDYRFYR